MTQEFPEILMVELVLHFFFFFFKKKEPFMLDVTAWS